MPHVGKAPSNNDPNYKIFRNVKDAPYNAKGDGQTDDTDAINRAINDTSRCGPNVCQSSTTSPAIVYLPYGTYLISAPLIMYYYTQIIGDPNPNCMPTLKATPNFNSSADPNAGDDRKTNRAQGLINGSPYGAEGKQGFLSVNTFFRQVRNLIFDMTEVRPDLEVVGIHWPVDQATSLQNLEFRMSTANKNKHQGLFIENGSGGFMADLSFHGGGIGMNVGSQQFTSRNLSFHDCNIEIYQIWDWGWTYANVSIDNCKVGFNISDSGNSTLNVGSLTLIDSSIADTTTAMVNLHGQGTHPDTAGSLYLENVVLHNVTDGLRNLTGTIIEGTSASKVIEAWADGHRYQSIGPSEGRGYLTPSKRPPVLLDGEGRFYQRSKPQYEIIALDEILSARTLGAMGDGRTDDTAKLNVAILQAAATNKILFIDAGIYMVTSTIYIPPGSRIVGEALASVIMSNGTFFNNINIPQPVVKVGLPGEEGWVEWSDMIVSTQAQQAGAILIEWNLASNAENDISGMWDVHARIGGFKGTNLQTQQCPKTPTLHQINANCIGAYMGMHITKYASGLYMENVWLWTADHDLDDEKNNSTQITVYTGRGLLVESEKGKIWMYGTAVEHFAKYQYQFVDTQNIVMGYMQTETAYYQPNPNAKSPFTNTTFNDPQFPISSDIEDTRGEGWGLRIVHSTNFLAYGAGLYSFFNNYDVHCSDANSIIRCQPRVFSIEECDDYSNISIYNLNTVGVDALITRDREDVALRSDNMGLFADTVNIFRTN